MTVETVSNYYSGQRNPYSYAKVEQVQRDIVTQWLTTSEIANQLNLFEDDSQDAYIESLDLAVRMAIEDYLGMAIFPTQWKVYYGSTGLYNTQVFLDLPEVSEGSSGITINKVQIYTTSNTAPVTVDPSNYSYDVTGNRVILNSVPNGINQIVTNPIVVTYTQNANAISQYPVIKQAGLLMLTHLYNNRATTSEQSLSPIPFGFSMLLRPYKPTVM